MTFHIGIESVGMIKPTAIISMAINILNEKLKNIQKVLNENIESKIKVDITNKLFKSYDFIMFDENHTLGNLISSYLLDNPKINYAAYVIPHPNDNKLVITTELKNNNTLKENIKVFLETLQNLINFIDKLNKEWETALRSASSVKKMVKKIIIKKSK